MTWSGILFELLCDLFFQPSCLYVLSFLFSFFCLFFFLLVCLCVCVCVCLVVLISMDISRKFSRLWFLGVLLRCELSQQLFKQQCQSAVLSIRGSTESRWKCGYTFNNSLTVLMHLIIGFFFTTVLQCSS